MRQYDGPNALETDSFDVHRAARFNAARFATRRNETLALPAT
ncbi:hypothetical protein [Natronorubrum sediminis]|nr:hypothetical protein [Natronorubrum sediminis]